ncbi:hypothetical protein M569_10710 [Genlisea aurea]|uniref:Homeobox-leucine zipper protein n=1 Tax=Genlisea aurea TaxID=192259 RepID=S8CB32_9LAMI|nr:hypothetical protein M569_10710 [Genlisea aurea]
MDWNGNGSGECYRLPSFVSRPESSFGFLYNYTTSHDQFSANGLEMKQPSISTGQMLPSLMGKGCMGIYGQDPKKKRLTTEQLESLENSFQEDVKLDPDRKMKLAKELGLQPRQIAVWFQNRRARWKNKQLESLYDALKQEYDAVSREKHKLQQEVMALRAILKDHVTKKQISTGGGGGYTDVSGEETVESTSIPSSDVPPRVANQMSEWVNVEDYSNPVMMTPYNWGPLT